MQNEYEFYQLKSEKDLISHEKLLYDSFIVRTPDKWIMNNYKIINNNRLQAPNDYCDLVIYGLKINDEIFSTFVMNKNNLKELQLENIGFLIPEYIKKRNTVKD